VFHFAGLAKPEYGLRSNTVQLACQKQFLRESHVGGSY